MCGQRLQLDTVFLLAGAVHLRVVLYQESAVAAPHHSASHDGFCGGFGAGGQGEEGGGFCRNNRVRDTRSLL